METRRDVFQAIADPTRREIIQLLAHQPMHLNAIAEKFDISRPAISQQIKILEACGLVHITQEGRQRSCQATLEKLVEVKDWVEQYKQYWENAFRSLDAYLEKIQDKQNP